MIELLIAQPGIGELRLLAPALRTLQPRAVVLINPPHTMQPLALHYWGLDSAHWCVLRERRQAAEARLALARGRVLGTLIFHDCKQTTSCVVTQWANGHGTLRGRRGRQIVKIQCDALAIEYAIKRFLERRVLHTDKQVAPQATLFT
ncbi:MULTISPECIES: hypothetical protein [Mycetohabitans]|uniref:hypothetical protein n=1 Tax=Mycetohabitans TaxID=2571159 RepID=UPI001BAEC0E6|nr:hypothetical protein [Mycetohabitans sp. B7]